MSSSPDPTPRRLADLALHDCPLDRVTLDFAGRALHLHISQYHEVRQDYEAYELIFRDVQNLSWTQLHEFPYGDDLEISSYAETTHATGLMLSFVLLTGPGGPAQQLAFRCTGYEVRRPAAID